MKIKQTKELSDLAHRAGLTEEDVESIALGILANDLGCLEDMEEDYGYTIGDSIDELNHYWVQYKFPKYVIKESAVKSAFEKRFNLTDEDSFNDFKKLVLFGEYDCPECGGKLEVSVYDGGIYHPATYYQPEEWEYEITETNCPYCGYQNIEKN